jgi:transcriptional regulator with XRE-family HTH domain
MKKQVIPNNRFKVARLNAGYTQREINRLYPFLDYDYLSLYENKHAVPSKKFLYFLPKLYKVSLDYLFCLDEYRNHLEFVKKELKLNDKSISILTKHFFNQEELIELRMFLSTNKEDL